MIEDARVEDDYICQHCDQPFRTEPFKLKCGMSICKHHLDFIEYGDKFECLICNKEHRFEENFDLSYKKTILVKRYKDMAANLKSRLAYYEQLKQDPNKFMIEKCEHLKKQIESRKENLKILVNSHYENLNAKTSDKVENSELRDECLSLNNFSEELDKFAEYLKSNQNHYIYYVYAQKLKLVNRILERKLEKMRFDIQERINNSLPVKQYFTPNLADEIFGKLSNNPVFSRRLVSFDNKDKMHVWDLDLNESIYSLDLNLNKDTYIQLFETKEYQVMLYNNQQKSSIIWKIYIRLLMQNRANLKSFQVAFLRALNYKIKDKGSWTFLLLATENGHIVIYDNNKDARDQINLKTNFKNVSYLNYFDDENDIYIACGSDKGNIEIFKIHKHNSYFDKILPGSLKIPASLRNQLKGHSEKIVYLEFKNCIAKNESVIKLMMISASENGVVKKWVQNCSKELEFELDREYNFCNFSSCLLIDDSKMAIGFSDGIIKIINHNTGEGLKDIKAHEGAVNCLIIKGSNRLFSCSNDKSIKEWDIEINNLIQSLNGHIYPIELIEFVEQNDFDKLQMANQVKPQSSSMSLLASTIN